MTNNGDDRMCTSPPPQKAPKGYETPPSSSSPSWRNSTTTHHEHDGEKTFLTATTTTKTTRAVVHFGTTDGVEFHALDFVHQWTPLTEEQMTQLVARQDLQSEREQRTATNSQILSVWEDEEEDENSMFFQFEDGDDEDEEDAVRRRLRHRRTSIRGSTRTEDGGGGDNDDLVPNLEKLSVVSPTAAAAAMELSPCRRRRRLLTNNNPCDEEEQDDTIRAAPSTIDITSLADWLAHPELVDTVLPHPLALTFLAQLSGTRRSVESWLSLFVPNAELGRLLRQQLIATVAAPMALLRTARDDEDPIERVTPECYAAFVELTQVAWMELEIKLLTSLKFQMQMIHEHTPPAAQALQGGHVPPRKYIRQWVQREQECVNRLQTELERTESIVRLWMVHDDLWKQYVSVPVESLHYQCSSGLMAVRIDQVLDTEALCVLSTPVSGLSTKVGLDLDAESCHLEAVMDLENNDNNSITNEIEADTVVGIFYRQLHQWCMNQAMSSGYSISEMLLTLELLLGRLEMAALDLLLVSQQYPVKVMPVTNGQLLKVHISLSTTTTMKLNYSAKDPHCVLWSLPSEASLCKQRRQVSPPLLVEAVGMSSPDASSSLLQTLCESLAGDNSPDDEAQAVKKRDSV